MMLKVKDVIDRLDNISEVRQVLLSATGEGTFITKEIVQMIQKILHDYEADIYQMDVISK